MSTTPTPRPKLSPSERLAMIANQANQPIACEKCGSQWFSDVSFQQYSGSRYATTPGGDLAVVSAMVHRIRVCLCGHPVSPNIGGVRPGRTANTEVTSFMESFGSAKRYLESIGQIDPEVIANDFPTRDEYLKVIEQVDALQAKLAALETKTLNFTASPTAPLAELTPAGEQAVREAVEEFQKTEAEAETAPRRAGGKFAAKNRATSETDGK